jgi:cysteinyl-tRNA synthetase
MSLAMDLKLYDTLTREKRIFTPLDPANVRMYVCGPTVYDFAHIGNARPVIVFDVLFRLLRHLYGADHVTYVRNITDVDDKINARAAEEYPDLPLNDAIRKVTEKTDKQFHEDVAALGCLPPTFEPRATEHIAEMKTLIERLIASDNAYVADGNVLFSVPSMPDYGQLSKRPLDEMIAGARVEVAAYKKDPRDFVLWKPSKPGEPAWPSPAGITTPGRPGWHIECSAMAWKYLGEIFDIHGGGIDLVFPHHEDEIAQSRCAFHTPLMANFWVHNGFLQVEGEKMAKSAGNFVTIRELLQDWPGEVIRFNMLRTHYRQPIDWTMKGLEESARTLNGWHSFIGDVTPAKQPDALFVEMLFDDLNTPSAIARLHQMAHPPVAGLAMAGLTMLGDRVGEDAQRYLKSSAMLIGILGKTVSENRRASIAAASVDIAAVELMISARSAARRSKDFKESDRIRDELAKMGVVLKDTKDGTTWEIAR